MRRMFSVKKKKKITTKLAFFKKRQKQNLTNFFLQENNVILAEKPEFYNTEIWKFYDKNFFLYEKRCDIAKFGIL